MDQNPMQSKMRQLLERLQEESWQLELLISGFAIFLIGSAYEPIQKLQMQQQVLAMGEGFRNTGLSQVPIVILFGTWFFLIINLSIHVVLRGFWIAAIGVRYISGDIDVDRLKLAPKFDRYLRKRLPSFDDFIEQLEKICSVVFAFTFLIIFVILSIGLFIGAILILDNLIDFVCLKLFSESVTDKINTSVILTLFLAGILYFIDFVTLGWVKRIKWFSVIYYPIYRLFSLLTLSFLYRPLYYNLIDNKFGRRVGFLVVPYFIGMLLISSINTKSFLFFPERNTSLRMYNENYVDQIKKFKSINRACIPTKFVKDNFVELFIPYSGSTDDYVKFLCPGLKPDKKVGTRFSGIQFSSGDMESSPVDSLLTCLSQLYEIHIDDSLYIDIDYMFYTHPNANEPGLLSVIDINHLERGKHNINVHVASLTKDSITYQPTRAFPFWKE